MRTPVRALSGGERNRLLLARLFTRRFNVLVLDEPTNDLDIETLDLLEDLLLEFSGTLLVVSHDRAFLDNVVTSTLVFEGGGRVARVCRRLRRLGAAASRRSPSRSGAPSKPAVSAGDPCEQRQETAPQLQGIEGTRGTAPGDRRTGAGAGTALCFARATRCSCATARPWPRRSRAWPSVTGEIATLTERWEALETLASEVG